MTSSKAAISTARSSCPLVSPVQAEFSDRRRPPKNISTKARESFKMIDMKPWREKALSDLEIVRGTAAGPQQPVPEYPTHSSRQPIHLRRARSQRIVIVTADLSFSCPVWFLHLEELPNEFKASAQDSGSRKLIKNEVGKRQSPPRSLEKPGQFTGEGQEA